MYELLANGQVLINIEKISDRQPNGKAVIQEPIGMQKKIFITPDKTNILVNNAINVTLQWQKFDLEQGLHKDDLENNEPFKINVAGEVAEITPVDGVATVQFSSVTAGEFVIKTVNPDVDNQSMKVVVCNAESK